MKRKNNLRLDPEAFLLELRHRTGTTPYLSNLFSIYSPLPYYVYPRPKMISVKRYLYSDGWANLPGKLTKGHPQATRTDLFDNSTVLVCA